MPTGPVLGIRDAKTNQWLQNVATHANSHRVAADPSNNHMFVPSQAGGICTTQSAHGCIGVYRQQRDAGGKLASRRIEQRYRT
jgi:hypothetical protein